MNIAIKDEDQKSQTIVNANNSLNKPKRTIRSFVCRNSKLLPSHQALYEKCWPLYGLNYCEGEMIKSDQIFSTSTLGLTSTSTSKTTDQPTLTNPIVLEIGFGRGDSLFEMAQVHPHINYIGIEVYQLGIINLLSKLEANPLKNLKIIKGDAQEILQAMEDHSLSTIQIFFPDPWPKLKHRKRRIIQKEFVEVMVHKLKPGGFIKLASDWEDYAKHMMKVLSGNPNLENTAGQQQFASRLEYRSLTKYEKRGINLGHGVWDLSFKRL